MGLGPRGRGFRGPAMAGRAPLATSRASLRNRPGRGQRCPRPRRYGFPVKTILVVDDEPEIVALCSDYLRASGYAVLSARDGQSALEALRTGRPDLVVLDLGLPRLDGLDVARALRATRPCRSSCSPRAPRSPTRSSGSSSAPTTTSPSRSARKELVARVRAVLRRAEGAHAAVELVRAGDVELDAARMLATVAGRRVDLTPTEFRLLLELARQPGRVFTRSQLLSAVQGVAFESYERAIDAHVKNLRRKIEDDPRAPRRLQTVFGVGYRMAEEATG